MASNINTGKILRFANRMDIDNPLYHHPITADVFLTNYCNNKCPFCTYRRWELDNDATYMSYQDFQRYATRLIDLGVQGIILSGGGEPTLNKDFQQIVNWLQDQGIAYGINTNFNRLYDFSPNFLKVSLDAWDEQSYQAKRGVRNYQLTRNNIIEYDKWRKESQLKTTLGIQSIPFTRLDVYKFYHANADLPVDYISIRPVESTGGKYYKEHNDAEEIIKAIQKIAEQDSRVVMNFKWNFVHHAETECSAFWAQIALNEKGEVMYCCQKPYQIVGHIMDEDILLKKERMLTDISMCDVPCRLTAPNLEVRNFLSQKDIAFI